MGGADLEIEAGREHGRPARSQRQVPSVARRAAWLLLLLIAVAALVGLVGPGPLSTTSRSAPSGRLHLTYDRFTRFVASTSLELRVRAEPSHPKMATVWISSAYLSQVDVQDVQPEPDSWTGRGRGVVLAFPVTGRGPVTVQLRIQPVQFGLLRGTVAVPGREEVRFWQFVYP